MKTSQKAFIQLFLTSTILGVAIGVIAYIIMDTYYTYQPLWVEHISYSQIGNLRFLRDRIGVLGRWQALLYGGLPMERHILQKVVLTVLSPQLLLWIHAHLILHIPLFIFFLLLFSLTLYRSSGSIKYTVGIAALFSAMPGLVNERDGLGAAFPDYQSWFLLSSAILALVQATPKGSLWWVRASGGLLVMTILARTTAVFYVGAIYLPICLYFLIYRYLKTASLKSVIILAANLFILILPAVVFIFPQLKLLFWYYGSSNSVGLKHPLGESWINIAGLFRGFVGGSLMLIMMLLGIKVRFLNEKNRLAFRLLSTDFIYFWWTGGLLVLLLWQGYTSYVAKEVMYITPALFLLAASPARKLIKTDKLVIILPIIFLGIAVIQLSSQSLSAYNRAKTVTQQDQEYRHTQLQMAETLVRLPNDIIWQSYLVSDWGLPVAYITYTKYGTYREAYNHLFHNKKNYWDAFYPGLSLEELQWQVYADTLDKIDVAVIMKDITNKPEQMEDYSWQIAKYISKAVQSDPKWKYFATIFARPYQDEWLIYRKSKKQ